MPTRLIACLIALIIVFAGFTIAMSQDEAPPPPGSPSLADEPPDTGPPPPPPGVTPNEPGNPPPSGPPGLPPSGPPRGNRPGGNRPRPQPPTITPKPPTITPKPPTTSEEPVTPTGNVPGEILPVEPTGPGRDYAVYKGDPAHTGYTEEHLNFPVKLLWKYMSEMSQDNPSSPAVKGGVVYFCAGTKLYAVNAETGSLRWRYPATESLTSTIKTSPVVGDGMVYFGAGDGRLYAISTADGSLVWSFVTRSNISSSPVLVDGVVYFGSDDQKLYALDANTGAMRWPGGFRTKDGIAAPPAVADGLVYFLSSDTILYAASVVSGQMAWATRLGVGSRMSTPVVAENTVYIAAGNILYALQSKSSRIKWSVSLPSDITTTPAVGKGVVYLACKDGKTGKLYAFTNSGKMKWKEPVDIGAPSYSSPIVADDTVILPANRGIIVAVDADSGALRWNYTILPSVLEYGSQRYKYKYVNLASAPVVSNGVLYVLADDGALHAFSADAPDSTGPRVETVRPLRNFLMPGIPPVEISAMVRDYGSGINESTIKLTLDGETVKHEIIPERGVIFYKTPRTERLIPLASGRHTASISLEDWAGNKTVEEWTFMVDNTLRTAPKATAPGGSSSGRPSEAAPPTESAPPGYR